MLGLNPQTDGPALRAQTGVLTETPDLDERLNAIEILAYTADLFDLPQVQVKNRVQELLTEFGLRDRSQDPVGHLVVAGGPEFWSRTAYA